MKSLTLLFCSLLVVSTLALGAPADPPAVAPASTPSTVGETLAADTPRTTHDGNGFIAPAGWSIRSAGAAVILTAPEGDSRIALVDVAAQDADAAVAAAWKAYDPAARWPLKLATDRVRRDGWEQVRSYAYETAAGDERGVSAQALRRGERWTVAIYDMATAVGDKREAQVDLIYQRLWPKGYSRESFAGRTAHTLDAQRVAALRQFVDEARRQFDVPGVAIGVVQNGKVVLAEGFGVRELGKPEKVDASTLFMIASNTKAMTTLLLAKLVDAGRFVWDTPVVQVLPSFRLGDAQTTRKVRIRHLVCACTGMPRRDMEALLQGEGGTPATLMATLATMQPTSPFGQLYQYSNAMAAAAGFVGGHALYPRKELGAAYDKAMQTQVFDPLGMTSTTFDFARAQRGNHAAPHARDVDGNTRVADMALNDTTIPGRPDGGAWSNVHDVLAYVQMELDQGLLPDGTRYIAQAPLLERRAQQVSTGSDTGYGMGLKIDRSWGTPLLHHGGSAFGYRSDMLWLPEHDVGAVILTNSDSGVGLRYPFRRRLVELLFDGAPEAAENVAVQARRQKESIAVERKRLSVPADAAAAGALAARYRSKELGDIAVTKRGTAVWFDFGGWKSEVASRADADGTVAFVTISPGKGGFEFAAAGTHGARTLLLRDAQHEYVFAEAK
jgi:CubicO group peptidase (beta-lactamase class C family)